MRFQEPTSRVADAGERGIGRLGGIGATQPFDAGSDERRSIPGAQGTQGLHQGLVHAECTQGLALLGRRTGAATGVPGFAHYLPAEPGGGALRVTQLLGAVGTAIEGAGGQACGLSPIAERDQQRESV
jgi:hypothetical protein